MFKATPCDNMFLKYAYDNEKELSYMLLKSLSPISANAVANADDLIRAWATVAKEALEGDHKEADLPCWDGHYLQFGRVMYHMLDVLVRKDVYIKSERFSDKQLAFFPFDNMIEPISMGYTGSHDRVFYRCWFNLIGHPNFQGTDVDDIEAQTYLYWSYILGTLSVDLGRIQRKILIGEADFLHV